MGCLVELESGKVALVVAQSENLLRPVLKVIYDSKSLCYIAVHELDLLKKEHEQIRQTIAPAKYKIDVASFI